MIWGHISLGVVLCLVLSLGGCISGAKGPESSSTESPAASPSAPAAVESQTPFAQAEALPDSKMASMSIEGESEEVPMQLYDEPSLPVMTYLPNGDFTPELSESEDGTGVRFYWTVAGQRDDQAYIELAFPKSAISVAELQEQITGEDGLIASNGWELRDRTEEVPYPWAREAIAFESNADGTPSTGYILIGEHDGSAFYASTHFPLEYGDGFGPRANLVFENLTFRE